MERHLRLRRSLRTLLAQTAAQLRRRSSHSSQGSPGCFARQRQRVLAPIEWPGNSGTRARRLPLGGNQGRPARPNRARCPATQTYDAPPPALASHELMVRRLCSLSSFWPTRSARRIQPVSRYDDSLGGTRRTTLWTVVCRSTSATDPFHAGCLRPAAISASAP